MAAEIFGYSSQYYRIHFDQEKLPAFQSLLKFPTDQEEYPKFPPPLFSVFEQALNYMHSRNTKVITTLIMKPLWIGKALIQDGLPCLNPNIIHFFSSSSWEVSAEKWPSHRVNGIPNSKGFTLPPYSYRTPLDSTGLQWTPLDSNELLQDFCWHRDEPTFKVL